jgi:hypothetical protein
MRLLYVRNGPRGLGAVTPRGRPRAVMAEQSHNGQIRARLVRRRRVLLFFPLIHTLERPLRVWTLHYSSSCSSALLRFASCLRSEGAQVMWLDALNVYDERDPARELQRILRPDNLVRMARRGSDGQEPQTRPVYRMGLTLDELVLRFRSVRSQPDEVCISSTFTWTWKTTHEAVALCREWFPDARIRLGGVYPTLFPDHAKSSGAHEVHAGVFEPVEHPEVDWRILARERRDSVALKASVGCPYRCAYCAVHNLEGARYRFRPAHQVIGEIETLVRNGVRNIHFWESNLMVRPQDHLIPMLKGIIERSLPVMLYAPEGIQPSLVTPEVARLMRGAGFVRASLTVETTDEARLQEVRRPSGPEEFLRAVRVLREAGFSENELEGVLLVGQPGQTLSSVATDLVTLWSSGVKSVLLAYTPIPGTEDFRRYGQLWHGRPLEDLDSFLFPLASEDLRVSDLECLFDRFNFRHATYDEVRDWEVQGPSEARVRDHLLWAFAKVRK